MSSFKRKVKLEDDEGGQSTQNLTKHVELSVSGVKPWVNTGLGIVSSGLRQLDELLGGGLPLGTTILHMNDNFSGFGQTLVGYSCAESVSHNHHTAILSLHLEDAMSFRSSLPLNRHIDPEPEPEKESTHSSGLTIAWQYEKYLKAKQFVIPRTSKSGSLQFCCSYDLSKRIQPSLEQAIDILSLESTDSSLRVSGKLRKMFERIQVYVESVLRDQPGAVVRIFVPNLESLFITSGESAMTQASALTSFMLRLKRYCWEKRVLVTLSVAPSVLLPSALDALQHTCDTILGIESFSGRMHCVPFEFNRFHGFLVIHKLQQYGMLAPHKLSSSRYGIIRDRRKLIIEPLHLPPEESRAFPAKEDSGKEAVGKAVAQAIGGCSSVPTIKTSVSSQNHSHGQSQTQTVTDSRNVTSSSSSSFVSTASQQPIPAAEAAKTSAPKSSLASSLAAARAARLAGATQEQAVKTSVQPISIAINKVPAKNDIDF